MSARVLSPSGTAGAVGSSFYKNSLIKPTIAFGIFLEDLIDIVY
jgi:hypothetical protein